jgi:glycosyltransferase involved in cell wall biosynthesis
LKEISSIVERTSGERPPIDVSVVLALFNEIGHVTQEIERIRAALEASHHSFEIIAVDDGSTDGSGEEFRRIDGTRLIRCPRNRGPGSARKAGTRAARGRVVVWTDADMTYPNDEIPNMVKELEGYDQAVGARTSEQGTAEALFVPARVVHPETGQLPHPATDPGSEFWVSSVPQGCRPAVAPPVAGGVLLCVDAHAGLPGQRMLREVFPTEYERRAGRSKFHRWADTQRYLTQVVRMILSFTPSGCSCRSVSS